MSTVPVRKFILLNVVGALAWAVAVGTGGYVFGHALEIIIGRIKQYEEQVFILVVLIGLLFWIAHFYRQRRQK